MGRFFSNIIFTIILIVAFKLNASEISDSCTVYLKNGQNVVVKFREVQSFCFVSDKGEGINYSVIDSLITSDSATAQSIFQSCPGISLNSREERYILKFLNCVPVRTKQESAIPFKPSNIALYLRSDPISRVGFVYNAELFNMKNFIHRFQGSCGFRDKDSWFSAVNFAFGLGFQAKKEAFSYSFTLNYGIFREFPPLNNYSASYFNPQLSTNKPNTPIVSGSVLFFSPVISYEIYEGQPYFITSGLDIYLNRENVNLPQNVINIYFGLGTEL
ncbi:MAG: hypothetical protein WC209_18330 [Ignavibacteriaceae bacterium]|jgi:hypothetical protein